MSHLVDMVATHVATPARHARYTSVRRLGDGAEGGAWLAHDVGRNGGPVVLKWISPERRLVAERAASLLRQVGSPHLPALVELVADEGHGAWLVAEHVVGEPLGPGPVPWARVVVEALGVARALAAIHAAGTHHGDVSPANVLGDEHGHVVLIDFGQLGEYGCGTPGFLAPEVLAGGGGPGSDRFALGCLICLRAFGRVPWSDPAALARVRDRTAIVARLQELSQQSSVSLDSEWTRLLAGLLDPDPAARVGDGQLLVRRLEQLARAGTDDATWRPGTAWSVPRRWPYRGVDLEPLVRAVCGGDGPAPRVVAVAGPSRSGRRRVVEELIGRLAAERIPVMPAVAEQLGPRLGRPSANWIEAWSEARSDATTVIGMVEPVTWPAAARHPRLRAAMLSAAAAWAQHVLVLSIGVEEGKALRRDASAEVLVVDVLPWSRNDLAHVVGEAIEGPHREAWLDTLLEVGEGWPARTLSLIEACAREGLDRPRLDAVVGLASQTEPAVDRETAMARLLAHWDDETPCDVGSGHEQPTCTVAAARARLAAEVGRLARVELTARLRSRRAIGLALAVDADAVDHVRAQLSAAGGRWPAAALRWAETVADLPADLRCVAARQCMAAGDPASAIRLADGALDDAACHLEAARALAAMGRRDEASERLDAVEREDTPDDLRWRARGLRWRLEIEAGHVDRVADAAEHSGLIQETRRGVGVATARLWAGFAAVQRRDRQGVRRWLDAALSAVPESADPDAASIRARVLQVFASEQHLAGELRLAARRYREAIAAFELAGETIGVLLTSASVAALAVPAGWLAEAERRGLASLRGLIAAAQVNALPTALLNTVIALVQLGRTDEARRWVALVSAVVHAAGEPSDVARLRLDRAALELRLAVKPDQGSCCDLDLVAACRRVGDLAEHCGATQEAADAYLRALGLILVDRRRRGFASTSSDSPAGLDERGSTTADLDTIESALVERVSELLTTGPDDALVRRFALVRLGLAAVAGHTDDTHRLAGELAAMPSPLQLRAEGQLELAFAHDRDLLLALDPLDEASRSARAIIRQRAQATMEQIMEHVSPLDRESTRDHFLSELERNPVTSLALAGQSPDSAASLVGGAETDPTETGSPAAGSRAERLLRIYRRFAREEDLGALLDQVVEAMMELTAAERGVVVVGEGPERIEVAREVDRQVEAVRVSRSILRKVMETGDAVLSVDAAEDLRFGESRSVSHLNLRSVLAVPLVYRGCVLGAAYVDHRLRRGAFDDADLAHLEDFANLAALAVAHARALGGLRAQADALSAQQDELARLLAEREAEVADLRAGARQAGLDVRQHRGMIGACPEMQRVFALIERLGDSSVPVIVHGESGTGKELVARAIHDAGRRRERPFVAENCGAVPDTLLESVLFGHVRGAFTGAERARAGLFEAADGGTIFLDEIGEMSGAMQTALLRVLQEGEVRRIGENEARKVDVRVIAASNQSLEALVEAGKFRQDLYYRIQVVKIELPPLRDRRPDLPDLIAHFLVRHGGEHLHVGAHAMRLLMGYGWPGNVRELENEVQRWVALAEDKIRPDDLSPAIRAAVEGDVEDPDDLHLRTRVDRLERGLIARALERTDGNQTRAAALLGLSRFGLQKKLRRLEADVAPRRPARADEPSDEAPTGLATAGRAC